MAHTDIVSFSHAQRRSNGGGGGAQVCQWAKTVRFRPVGTATYRTLIGNPVLEVEPTSTSQPGPVTTGIGRNNFYCQHST